MYISINIRNKNISVQFQEKGIAILNDEELSGLVTKMPVPATDELVAAIKKEFRVQFNKDMNIKDASVTVEIWGHVFAERFADAIKAVAPVKWVNPFTKKIDSHCKVINIGNKENDRNRILWDSLAVFKPAIAALLLQ
jgi:hypothetical protein